MRKRWLAILLGFISLTTLVFLAACKGSADATSTTKTQVATVQKGNISLTVTGTGNLAFAKTQDLSFDMAGTVEEVLVEAGQTVTEGQELAKLDTSAWQDQIKTLQKAVTTAQRNLSAKESSLAQAQRNVSAKELAVKQAELDVQSAQNALSQITAVKQAQDKVDRASYNLQFAQSMLKAAAISGSEADVLYWQQEINARQQDLNFANQELKSILSGSSTKISSDVVLQVAQAQLKVEQAQKALEDARIAVEDARLAVTNAQQDRDDAAQALLDAQNDLAEAQGLSPVIKAPFDGFITKVNVKGGDAVQKGTVAMQIADPNQFAANIMVTEQDIFSVKIGGDATVSLDALSGLSFPAKVTAIAPLATISQGVVNYKVTVQLTSTRPVFAGQFSTNQGAFSAPMFPRTTATSTPGSTSGTTAGNTTTPVIPGGASSAGRQGTFSGNPTAPNITLRDGLTAVVDIIIQQKNDVLIVPSRAITRQGMNYTVQVIKGSQTETRTVKIGISDDQNTEITEGLSEGEQVAIKTSSSTSTTTNNRFGVPGGGEFRMVVPR